MMPPIPQHIANRPRPQLPDKVLTLRDAIYYYSDLACWIADKEYRYSFGVEDND